MTPTIEGVALAAQFAAAPAMRQALTLIREKALPGQQLDIHEAIEVICDIWNIADVTLQKIESEAAKK